MKINLIWVGKTKEQFVREGIQKYIKLIKPFAELNITELKDEKGKNIQKVIEKEGERILNLKTPYVLFDERGRNLTSRSFSEFISGSSSLNFVIGGAYGVSESVRNRADYSIALSKMTFTHEMSRVFILEQLYRAFTIVHKRGYHH